MQRENGLYTYFASDIAYHLNKYERGFDRIIDIWGADHHGYIPRVKVRWPRWACRPKLEVALVQFAVLYRNGQKASMSTRSGEFVTLRELRREVGNDACRFFYVLRKADQHLDFDLDLAKSQTNENPVYYIQYAHARIVSVLKQWGGELPELAAADMSRLEGERELALCARLASFPEVILAAAEDYAPHQVAFYLGTSPAISTAGTTPTACWSRTKASSWRASSSLRRFVRRSRTVCACSAYPRPKRCNGWNPKQ